MDYSVDSYWGGASLGSALVPSTPMQAIPHALVFVAVVTLFAARRRNHLVASENAKKEEMLSSGSHYGALNI